MPAADGLVFRLSLGGRALGGMQTSHACFRKPYNLMQYADWYPERYQSSGAECGHGNDLHQPPAAGMLLAEFGRHTGGPAPEQRPRNARI